MSCASCLYWQGTKLAVWADCNRVIGEIEPRLFYEKDKQGFYFNVPFDPHDIYKYHHHSNFSLLYHNAMEQLPNGVRVDKDKGLKFLMTRRDYYCERHCSKERGST